MMTWVALPLSHVKNEGSDPEDPAADKVYEDGVALSYTGTNESFFGSGSPYYATLYAESDGLTARVHTSVIV